MKLSNQIGKVVCEMKKHMACLNTLCDEDVSFDEIKDPQSEVYSNIVQSQQQDPIIASRLKKRLVDLTCMQDRCEEEVKMVKNEMLTFLKFIQSQDWIIDNYLRENSDCADVSKNGLRCHFLQKRVALQKYLQSLKDTWKHIIEIPTGIPQTPVLSYFSVREEQAEIFSLYDCDCCEEFD